MEENKEVVNTVENTENVEATETVVKAKTVTAMTLDDGTVGSRSAYIRQEFNKDRARADIATELEVPYYIVYSATTNMFNAVHTEEGGSAKSAVVLTITKEGRELIVEPDAYNGEEELIKIARPDYARELMEKGMARGEVAKYLEVPYSSIYSATKDLGVASSGRVEIIHPETEEVINRADYIRELYDDGNGMTRKAIAVHITKMTDELCDYSTVWAATKPAKVEEEVVAEEVVTEEVLEVAEEVAEVVAEVNE